jgi:hypothetical protein
MYYSFIFNSKCKEPTFGNSLKIRPVVSKVRRSELFAGKSSSVFKDRQHLLPKGRDKTVNKRSCKNFEHKE